MTYSSVRPLTAKQRLFIDGYLKTWNATEAARRARYQGNDETLASMGAENLRKPQIRAAIEKRLKAHQLSSDRILARLGEMGMANIADFLDDTGKFDLAKLKARGYPSDRLAVREYAEHCDRIDGQKLEAEEARHADGKRS